MRRFFAAPAAISSDKVTLGSDETHHLRDVVRLREGAEVSVFDGLGKEYICRIAVIEKTTTVLHSVREINSAAPESPLRISVAATVLPGDKYDLIVQKMVELGVVRMIPLVTIRSETTVKDAARRMGRWQRIALEATKQCGRARLMEISGPTDLDTLLSSTVPETTILFSERRGASFTSLNASEELTVLFGPKGGWDDNELDKAAAAGLSIITMGGRILKAETAAIAMTAILQNRFGDIN